LRDEGSVKIPVFQNETLKSGGTKMKRLITLLFSLLLVLALSVAPSVMAASAEDEVLQVMTNWFKAFNTNDYELMSSLWWHSPKTLRFGPSKSGTFLDEGWDVVAESWRSMFKQPIGSYANSMRHPHVMMLGDNVAIISAFNVSITNPPAVKEQTTELVRGTFVVQRIGGKWLIVYEHSSLIPEE
jgi:uncharacterized protein (TIGR02246 family)